MMSQLPHPNVAPDYVHMVRLCKVILLVRLMLMCALTRREEEEERRSDLKTAKEGDSYCTKGG